MIGTLRSLCYLDGGIGVSIVGICVGQSGFEFGFGRLVTILLVGAVCTVVLWRIDRDDATANRYAHDGATFRNAASMARPLRYSSPRPIARRSAGDSPVSGGPLYDRVRILVTQPRTARDDEWTV